MRINKTEGFTLIELLAVIIILAIIALISTPIIVNVIENAQTTAKMNSALGLIDSAIAYYTRSIANPEDYPMNYSTNILNSIPYIGERPETRTGEGYGVYLNSAGKVAMAISYDGTCYKKGYTDTTVTTLAYDEATCTISPLPRKESILNGSDPSYETGLIPIVYDETVASPTYRKWVKADIYSTTNTWYSYENRKWANAVMVTDASRATYEAATVGTEILEVDILGYLVWIPRYEYKFTGMAVANAILINFIPSTTTAPSDAVNYKVHPAFTFGTEELSGIWIGKFETTGTGANPTVKPNLASLKTQDVSTQFETSQVFNTYGLGLSNDAHMMKNSEWGAVAYLSHSIYGSCSNATTCTEIYVNNSSSMITGRSGGGVSGSNPTLVTQYPGYSSSTNRYYAYGYYTYDGKIVEYGGATTTYAADITLGTRASTTGNIYGIYDMSGGLAEYVMGVYSNATNNNGYPGYSGNVASENSGYNGWLGGSSLLKTNGKSWPNGKYYELFTSLSAATACDGGICYGHALSETSGWYGDYTGIIMSSTPWFIRGGQYGGSTSAGAFSSSSYHGYGYSSYSAFRLVISS